MEQFHWSNDLLPSGSSKDVFEGSLSLSRHLKLLMEEINEVIGTSKAPECFGHVFESKLGRFLKLIKTYDTTMSFNFSVEERSALANLLLNIYFKCRLTVNRKECVLNSLRDLLNRKDLTVPNFELPWKDLWEEALNITLIEKSKNIALADAMTGNMHNSIINLLHDSRSYIPERDLHDMVEGAMVKLADTSQPGCLEGVLLLNVCLPTAYKGYDDIMPQWLQIWDRLRHNPTWDMCWLTLLSRARKHANPSSNAWDTVSTLLQIKARTLLNLPGSSVEGTGMYPFKFPHFYEKLLPRNASKLSHAQTAMMKLTKLLYFMTLRPVAASGQLVLVDPVPITLPRLEDTGEETKTLLAALAQPRKVRAPVADIIMLLQSLRPFFYASNVGPWTTGVSLLIGILCGEVSRHVARNLVAANKAEKEDFSSNGQGPVVAAVMTGYAIFEQPLHIGTLRFLLGNVTAVAMEGIYSKGHTMQHLCGMTMKNVIAVDPTLGHVIVPFLLQALNPKAVSQSHQAPAAMVTLTSLVKPLMYPCPVLAQYLPELMALSLPGIDPNDTKKSIATLKMYIGLLGSIPIRSNYGVAGADKGSYPPPYLSLTNAQDPSSVDPNSEFGATYARTTASSSVLTAMTNASAAFESWAPQLLERLFTVFEAMEEPKKGTPQSPVVGQIDECVENLFVALEDADSALKGQLENMVLEYFKDHNPVNAAKICAKVMGKLVDYNLTILPKIVDVLVTEEVLRQQCSKDRLAFRLRLLAGAARNGASGVFQCMDVWKVLTGPSFVYHSEKLVRRASMKLLKELLRGSVSLYPRMHPTLRGATDQAVVGAPFNRNHVGMSHNGVLEWYEPSTASLSIAADLMRDTAGVAIKEIRSDVADIKAAGSGSSLDVKKIEERLAHRLKLVSKVLKGAAEVLGDEGMGSTGSIPAAVDDSASDEAAEAEMEDKEVKDFVLDAAGPEGSRLRYYEALEKINSADAVFYRTFRGHVMALLLEVRAVLRIKPAATGDQGMDSLGNSTILHKYWSKTLNFLVKLRSCDTKNLDIALRWHSMELNNVRSVLTRTMRKCMSIRHGCHYEDKGLLDIKISLSNDQWRAAITRKAYWDTHDVAVISVVRRILIQYYLRLSQWSFESMRRAMWSPMDSKFFGRKAYMAALNFLIDVCQHEYDVIRNSGRNIFSTTIGSFVGSTNYVIKRLLSTELNSDSTKAGYASTIGALRLLHGKYILRRILGNWDNSVLFFDTLRAMPALTAKLDTDEAKKEIVAGVVASTFVQYIAQWHHIPTPPSINAGAFLISALDKVGYTSDGEHTMDLERASSGSGGIRYETFNSFVVMALIGHPDIEVPTSAWIWALRTVATAHGQPAQQLAYGAMCRLLALRKGKSGVLNPDSDEEIKKSLQCSETNPGLWPQLLQGLSAIHPKQGEGSAQWSGGVENTLKTASNYMAVSSSKIYSIAFDSNVVSPCFLREASVMFANLFSSGLIDLISKEGLATLEALLTTAKGCLGEGVSDSETRNHNAAHAELFGGLLRAVLESAAPTSASLVEALLKHYEVASEKISLEYAKDWDEALLFACSGPPTPLVVPFLRHLTTSFKLVLESGSSKGGKSCGDDADEGFNKEGKRLVSLAVFVRSQITSSWQKEPGSPVSSDINKAMASDLVGAIKAAGNGLVSPYRTSRSYMIAILRSLLVRGPLGSHLELSSLRGLYEAIIDSAEMESTKDDPAADPADVSGDMDLSKNALDMVRFMLASLTSDLPIASGHAGISASQKEACHNCVVALTRCAMKGSGHHDSEAAKLCHAAVRGFVAALQRGVADNNAGDGEDVLGAVLRLLPELVQHASFRVRLTVIEAAVALMAGNWPHLLATEKVLIKETLTAGFTDTVPEVQQLSQAGFAGYLSFKTNSEMQKLSESFCRNSDKYVAIDRQKKKQQSAAGNEDKEKAEADPKFLNMVNMMCCIVRAFPYDLPSYIPHLLACLVRHTSSQPLKEPISKTILEFKRTHQDRWSEFKELFSADQLDSLVGASHLSYLS